MMRSHRDTANSFDRDSLAKRVTEWASSTTGTESLVRTQQAVRLVTESAEQSAQIDQELLRTPITL